MGAWGNGILQDDVAADVQIVFEDALAEGLNIERATQRALDANPWPALDYEEGCRINLAMAALQLQHGVLMPAIREAAIEAATSEWAISCWEGSPQDRVAVRESVLRRFRAILERGSCTSEELEQVTYPKEFSLW